MPEIIVEAEWREIGPAPLVLTIAGDRHVAYVASAARPDADLPTSNLLVVGQDILVCGDGMKIFARAEKGEGLAARVLARSPRDFLTEPVSINVGTSAGRLLLEGLPASGVSWRAVEATGIAAAEAYQVLFPAGSARSGGYIVNTSAPGSDPLWVDPTGATGSDRSNGAMPVYPAPDGGSAPGGWRVPPTLGAVTIMGPAGATFRAFHG